VINNCICLKYIPKLLIASDWELDALSFDIFYLTPTLSQLKISAHQEKTNFHTCSTFQWNRGWWYAFSLSRDSMQKIFTSKFYQCMDTIHSLYWQYINSISVSLTGESNSAMICGQGDLSTMISQNPRAPCFGNVILYRGRGFVSTSGLQELRTDVFTQRSASWKV
jgi:hypothetical protein